MKRVINGKMYNTATADEIIADLYKGVGTSTDLYRKKSGEFFYAHYTQWDGQRDSIEPISEGEAKEVIGEYDGGIYVKLFGNPEEIEEAEKQTVYVVTYVGLSDSEYDANGYSKCHVYGSKEAALAKLKALRNAEIENCKAEGRRYEVLKDEDDECRISWCGDEEQVRIEVHEAEKH